MRQLWPVLLALLIVTPALGENAPTSTAKKKGAPVIEGGAASSIVTSRCDGNGNCQNGTTGVGRSAPVTCISATGQNPGTYPPACYFYCVPNCGNATLRPGQAGQTSGAGTVTLVCNGQVPLSCSLRVD